MKRNSKSKSLVVTAENDAVISIVTSEENSDVTVEAATEIEIVESEIVEDEIVEDIITIEATDVTGETSAIDALLESAEEPVIEAVEQLERSEVEELIAAAEAATEAAAPPPTPATKTTRAPKVSAPVVPIRNFSDVAAMDKASLSAQLVAGTTAKKIIEKAENLIAAVESGKKLSRYTSIAVKALIANGTVSGKSLVDTFTGEGLGLGTARSQAQQMTTLFKMAGIATANTGSKDLVLADTNLAQELAGMSV
jgi:hypothetical protein